MKESAEFRIDLINQILRLHDCGIIEDDKEAIKLIINIVWDIDRIYPSECDRCLGYKEMTTKPKDMDEFLEWIKTHPEEKNKALFWVYEETESSAGEVKLCKECLLKEMDKSNIIDIRSL